MGSREKAKELLHSKSEADIWQSTLDTFLANSICKKINEKGHESCLRTKNEYQQILSGAKDEFLTVQETWYAENFSDAEMTELAKSSEGAAGGKYKRFEPELVKLLERVWEKFQQLMFNKRMDLLQERIRKENPPHQNH